MGGGGFLGLGPGPDGPQYGSQSELLTAASKNKKDVNPPAVPTPGTSQPELTEAQKQQQRARGAASTIFRGGGSSGSSSSDSGFSYQRMLLGS